MHETAMQLPLSWKQISGKHLHTRFVELKKTRWLSLAEVPQDFNTDQIVRNLSIDQAKRLVIRGCNSNLAKALQPLGFESAYMGQEAVLDLSTSAFNKKSLSQLAERGLKKGSVSEIPFSKKNQQRIKTLAAQSVHGTVPQLTNLFRNHFEGDMRAFVYRINSGEWLAAITLSKSGKEKMHTELLLRKAKTPAGTMEALIRFIECILKSEGWNFWSLGEVPFIPDKAANTLSERLIIQIGRRLNFAYRSHGLFHFKNKFSPRWEPLYLCAKPGVNLPVLYTLFVKSNLLKLAWFKLYWSLFKGKDQSFKKKLLSFNKDSF